MAGIFNGAVLTEKGLALLAKAQAGECTIELTKAASGSGSYSDSDDLQSMTELKSKQQEFGLATVRVQNTTNIFVRFIITNNPDDGDALTTGYYVTEIGLYATDPDDGEILYAIATAVEDQWDYMPSYNDLIASKISVEFLVEVANADETTIVQSGEYLIYDVSTGGTFLLGLEDGNPFIEEVV